MNEEKSRSLSETNNWEHIDREKNHAQRNTVYTEISKNIDTSKPEDKAIQEYVKRHYQIVSNFCKPIKQCSNK